MGRRGPEQMRGVEDKVEEGCFIFVLPAGAI